MTLQTDLYNSLKDGKDGFGAKRLTTFATMTLFAINQLSFIVLVFVLAYKVGDNFQKFMAICDLIRVCLYLDVVLIALLHSLITVPQLIALKNGTSVTTETTSATTSSESTTTTQV